VKIDEGEIISHHPMVKKPEKELKNLNARLKRAVAF